MNLHKLYISGIMLVILLNMAQASDAKRIVNVFPLDKAYYREARLVKELTALARDNGSFVKLHKIGITQAGKNPIYALQIQTEIDRQPVLIVGQHHGDEVLGLEIAMEFAKKLVQNPADAEVANLLDRYSFWIVPTLNPDGWITVTSGKYQWKRKNNSDTNQNRRLNYKTDGVDLNRNYPLFWELDREHPEHSPYYKGTAPASENEVQAIVELASMIRFRYAFFYHSSITGTYAEKIYLPWQDRRDRSILQDFIAMRSLAETYATLVPRDYAEGTYSVHPGNTSKIGNSRNYFFYEWGTYAYDIEVGGVNKQGVGIIHPRANMRDNIVKKNLRALMQTLSASD